MLVVDTNVLVYAADTDALDHATCRSLLERLRGQPRPRHLTWGIAYEFLRLEALLGLPYRSRLAA